MSSIVPISAADVSKLIEIMEVDRVIACDLNCGQIQGFFGPRIPVDNLIAGIVAVPHFQSIDLINPVIISPDAGGVYRAKTFLGFLATPNVIPGFAMTIKQRAAANQVERMDLVGSVEGADCIIADDLIDTAGTLCEAAAQLKKHGLFSRDALSKIHNSPLEQVIVTNAIPLPGTDNESSIAHLKPKCEGPTTKIKQLSVAMLLAESIRRSHQKESLSQLFYPKGFKGE
jgi:ribose-phosphate pyrophosphokinase